MIRARMRIRFDTQGRIHQIEFDDGAMDSDEDEVSDTLFLIDGSTLYEKIIDLWPDDTWEDITERFDHGTWIERTQTVDEQFENRIDRNTVRERVDDVKGTKS